MNLTPVELRQLTQEQLREELKRLPLERRKALMPEQVAVVMEVIDPRHRLTPEEEHRQAAARKLADPEVWSMAASSTIESILRSYELGEVTFQQALEIVGRISIGCWPQGRIQILGMAATLALRIRRQPAKKRGQHKPRYPSCIKIGTAEVILSLKKRQPATRRVPTAYDSTSPIILQAIDVLTTMRWFGDAPTPAPRTIDDWVRERLSASNQKPPKGRPRTKR